MGAVQTTVALQVLGSIDCLFHIPPLATFEHDIHICLSGRYVSENSHSVRVAAHDVLLGYFNNPQFRQDQSDSSLPDDTIVVVGYSAIGLLVMLIVTIILLFIPIALALKKLPKDSVDVGNNSIAISAACHVSSVSNVVNRRLSSSNTQRKNSSSFRKWLPSKYKRKSSPGLPPGGHGIAQDTAQDLLLSPHNTRGDIVEMQELSNQSSRTSLQGDMELPAEESVYEQIARSRVRWGVVKMPPEFYTDYENHGRPYEHLSFGVEEDEVDPPVYMRHYA
jgi:hypothetical protein